MESLYDPSGNRLYLTKAERDAFMTAVTKAPRDVRSFCEALHFAGCRVTTASKIPESHDIAQVLGTLALRLII